MPRFYFHVERDGERIVDDEGSELSDLQNVQEAAVRAAADLAADDLKLGAQSVEQFIIVENGSGQDVVRVRVFALLYVQRAESA
jgi:hypothetical protein